LASEERTLADLAVWLNNRLRSRKVTISTGQNLIKQREAKGGADNQLLRKMGARSDFVGRTLDETKAGPKKSVAINFDGAERQLSLAVVACVALQHANSQALFWGHHAGSRA
jgi:hypothetical protein